MVERGAGDTENSFPNLIFPFPEHNVVSALWFINPTFNPGGEAVCYSADMLRILRHHVGPRYGCDTNKQLTCLILHAINQHTDTTAKPVYCSKHQLDLRCTTTWFNVRRHKWEIAFSEKCWYKINFFHSQNKTSPHANCSRYIVLQ